MPATFPPLDFDHKPSFKIAIKHKNIIRELHSFEKKTTKELIAWYKLIKSIIYYVLDYKHLKQARPIQTRRPKILINTPVDKVIKYFLET